MYFVFLGTSPCDYNMYTLFTNVNIIYGITITTIYIIITLAKANPYNIIFTRFYIAVAVLVPQFKSRLYYCLGTATDCMRRANLILQFTLPPRKQDASLM